MAQAIAGVSPVELGEVSVMTVWPSNAAYVPGRFLGRLYESQAGFYIFTLGNLWALLSIPVALGLYFVKLIPGIGFRFKLTNRRVLQVGSVLRREWVYLFGFIPWPWRFIFEADSKSLELDRFDNIHVDVQPGQAWYHAGNLSFRLGNVETLRLVGVSRPEAFRSACIKAHLGYVGVKKALAREVAHA